MDSLIRNRVVQLKSLSSLARLFYPFGVSRRVFAGPAKGLRFVVKPGFGLTYAFGWDAFNLDFLSSKIRRDTVVYDIGANRGQTTIAFAKFVGAEG